MDVTEVECHSLGVVVEIYFNLNEIRLVMDAASGQRGIEHEVHIVTQCEVAIVLNRPKLVVSFLAVNVPAKQTDLPKPRPPTTAIRRALAKVKGVSRHFVSVSTTKLGSSEMEMVDENIATAYW
jgi:hypothetical protein